MIGSDIANVYRRFTRRNDAAASLPSADALIALTEGDAGAETDRILSDAGRFGLHADLLRFAADLAPESARLGVQLEQAFDAHAGGERGRRDRRAAQAPRRNWLRMAGAVAAGLVVAIAAWTYRHDQVPPQAGAVAAAKTPKPDRIFAALGGDRASGARSDDEIFRGAFAPDHIFRSKFSGG
jgi:hypothetical protein